jgi:hypothetical protein
MVFIPTWIINILLFGTFVLTYIQHWRLGRRNPLTNIQFVMMVFLMTMILVVTLYNRNNALLSLGFFLTDALSLA